MIQFLIKLLISSGIIIIVSEISKKDTLMGGIIVSIPLVSVLSMVWLYLETKNVENVSALSTSILWLIIPSLTLFIVLPIFIKSGINFFISMSISILITMGCYWIMIIILGRFGIEL